MQRGMRQTLSQEASEAFSIAFEILSSFEKYPVWVSPRAIVIASVKVAISTIPEGFLSLTQLRASARMSLPSASVLLTSTVLPFLAVCTSPGFVAPASGMFSEAGTTARRFTFNFSLAIASDHSIVSWGLDIYDLGSPPAGYNYVAIAAGEWHGLALTDEGTIVGWGLDDEGQATPPDGNDFVAIAAGGLFSLALKSDGTVVGWGHNHYGQANPPAIDDYLALTAGTQHFLALKSDGSIIGWGYDLYGRATPPDGNDYDDVAAGFLHSVA